MKKQDVIFEKNYGGIRAWIDISDIPQEFLQPKYKIDIEKVPAEYYSDSSHEDFTILRIIDYRDLTEEEKQEMVEEVNRLKKESKEERRKLYKELKRRIQK
jgi:hypothetical protein